MLGLGKFSHILAGLNIAVTWMVSIIIIIIVISLLGSFSHQFYVVVSYWSLNESKSPQVSRTHLRVLIDLNNAVVCMVIIFLISNSSIFFSKAQ